MGHTVDFSRWDALRDMTSEGEAGYTMWRQWHQRWRPYHTQSTHLTSVTRVTTWLQWHQRWRPYHFPIYPLDKRNTGYDVTSVTSEMDIRYRTMGWCFTDTTTNVRANSNSSSPNDNMQHIRHVFLSVVACICCCQTRWWPACILDVTSECTQDIVIFLCANVCVLRTYREDPKGTWDWRWAL